MPVYFGRELRCSSSAYLAAIRFVVASRSRPKSTSPGRAGLLPQAASSTRTNPRLVVLDMSVIQGTGRNSDPAGGDDILIPDRALRELAAKPFDEAAIIIGKIIYWSKIRNGHLFIGAHPQDLFRKQARSDGTPLVQDDIVHLPSTERFNTLDLSSDAALRRFLQNANNGAGATWIADQNEKIMQLCDAFKQFAAEMTLPTPEAWHEYLSIPDMVCFAQSKAGDYWCPHWVKHLESDEHCIALIRWLKLIGRYCLLRARGQERGFGDRNNFDDLEYALLASYTESLKSRDKGQILAARSLFPWVRVIS